MGTEQNPDTNHNNSGVAGPLAAQGGGQICGPFVLGF